MESCELFGKNIVIFGGAGSLGRVLTRRLMEHNNIFIFSRDEAKHHYMKQDMDCSHVQFCIGDVRDSSKVKSYLRDVDPEIVINAAAMKQVPACEFFPEEALFTNTIGTKSIVDAVDELFCGRTVLSISTDKACLPVNAYGMTKALQERIHLNGKNNNFKCVRYGNVLESTGSVIPFFKDKIQKRENLPVTHEEMTRFFLSLEESVDLILFAINSTTDGAIFVPKVRSAKITDLAEVMLEDLAPELDYYITKIRPGEKIHEILISEDETRRTYTSTYTNKPFVIYDIKREDVDFSDSPHRLTKEYSSKDYLMTKDELRDFLRTRGVI